jgi:predicted nucleotide-binding protein (sugar kinase/HSP70/actin superfamily)
MFLDNPVSTGGKIANRAREERRVMSKISQKDYRAYAPRPFTREERDSTTLLFGGLTWRAERALEGVFNGSGYHARALPNATRADLLRGRELADVGQCCPTAFTAGNLANFLLEESKRDGAEKVMDDYAYFSAGSCGSCRFGQYHQSYELALNNLGMDAFRLFFVAQQDPAASHGEGGLDISPQIIAKAVLGVLAADVIQDVEYQLRPYELEPGATDRAARASVEDLYEVCKGFRPPSGTFGLAAWALLSREIIRSMRRAGTRFAEVKVDRLRVKPKVKITGEFYLQTVEGDPNYNIHSWLEGEGAEVYPAPIVIWLDYLLRFQAQYSEERHYEKGARARLNWLRLASKAILWRHDQMRRTIGGLPHRVPRQHELKALAAPYYDGRLSGGEGDMLIGKAIWAHTKGKAHMIAELSPYGCMPNTMSLGAMAAVQGKYPDMLFAALEVKGDSEVHALSRCQMILTEAKVRAAEEFDRALHASGLTLEQARDKLARSQASGMQALPERGAAGTAANIVLQLGGARL